MSNFCHQREGLDLVQEFFLSVKPKLSKEEHKKRIKAEALAKHNERIRDGFKCDDGLFSSKGVKLSPVEQVFMPDVFAKMVQAEEEALEKLLNEQNEKGSLPDAAYENFCEY